MNSIPRPFDAATEVAASLYVLDLLPPDERRVFEKRLNEEAALRELVRELQGNLDALALDVPPRPAPLHVWSRIAARTRLDQTPTIPFLAHLRVWAPRVLAAAACVALGAGLQVWFTPSPLSSPDVSYTPSIAVLLPPAPAPADLSPPRRTLPVPVPTPPPVVPANDEAAREAAALRERVRVLASQVAALNQVLTQQESLPNGFTRLNVFRLVDPTRPAPPEPELQPDDDSAQPENFSLPEALAALAARSSSVATGVPYRPTPETLGTAGTTTPTLPKTSDAGTETPDTRLPPNLGDLSALADPGTPVAVRAWKTSPDDSLASADETSPTEIAASPAPANEALNDGQPLGFYDPDSGHGAIALTLPDRLVMNFGQVQLVAWSIFSSQTGERIVRNVGDTTPVSGLPAVISFHAPVSFRETPSFFVTLEPTDSDHPPTVPTGPVVAGPPPQQP